MPTSEQIQQSISRVNDQTSFIQGLLYDALQWPVDGGIEKVEDISFAWTDQELNAEGLERHIIDGQVWQIQPLREKQPWGIFLLDFKSVDAFTKGRGLTGPLRKVLRGLVSRRRKANLPIWQRENLLFICTHQYQYFRFGYFKAPKETKTAPLITFGWGPDTPARTACEFNLPALAWPENPDDTEAWREQWLCGFDKEKLTKDFFKTFANLYHEVVDDIAKVRELKDEAGRLAQLLLDRMLFLYFIQRKGWLDQKSDYLYSRFLECWDKDPDGHSYYSSALYPIFLSLSNPYTKMETIGAVPFLNGGLFEESAKQSQTEQIAHARLQVRNSTFKLIFDKLLERFNFTVTEDTPLDVEVAIDPEMLGKIFESLILQLEKEPGKDLRKLTGSYYTPRPIVHFMCKEALKEYLVTQLAGDDNAKSQEYKRKLEDLIKLPQADQMDHEQIETLKGLFTPAEARILRQSILDCRICDPAVGSGAFPVGMLHEMVAAIARLDLSVHGRDILTQHNYYYDLKKQIVESCLYGVDIQEQAVRLCELRLWLSLVVDYQIDPTKSFDQAIREVPSLPNLSYRIVRGDSLLERLFGHVIQLDVMAKDAKTKQLIGSIQADKQAYFREGNNEEKRRLELKILAKQADLAERLIEAKKSALSYTANIFGEEETKAKDRKAKAEHEKRLAELAELKTKVAGAKAELERLNRQKGTINRGVLDTLRSQYFHTGDVPTFVWQMDFAEVFEEKDGFDIVVGNPPYVRISGIDEQEDKQIRQNYETVFGHYDIYVPFIEKGVHLLSQDGTLAYITPNKYLTKRYANKLRPFLLNKTKLIELIDTSQAQTFDSSSVYPVISILTRRQEERKTRISIIDDSRFELFFHNYPPSYDYSLDQKEFRKNKNSVFDIFIDQSDRTLFNKIESESETLGSYAQLLTGTPAIEKFYQWGKLIVPEDEAQHIKKQVLRFINVSNIKPYFIEWGKEIRAVKKRTIKPCLVFDEKLVGKNKWKVFCKKKIVIKGTAKRLTASYDAVGYANLSLYAVIFNEDHENKDKTLFHLALLNSKLLNFWYCKKFASMNLAGNYISFNGIYLSQLPIKRLAFDSRKTIIEIVDKILVITKDKDYLNNPAKQAKVQELEKQIDQMVYKLYDLTKEEIAIVEEHSKSN